jgi:hypothetical protein
MPTLTDTVEVSALSLDKIKTLCHNQNAVVIFPDVTQRARVYAMQGELTREELLRMLELNPTDNVQYVPIERHGLALFCDESGAVKVPAAALNCHASMIAGKFVHGGDLLGPIIFMSNVV